MKSGFGLGGDMAAALPPERREDLRHGATDLSEDETWMRLALRLAMPGAGAASPNPSVGAVFVKDGAVLAQGATEAYGGRHGETVALAACADRGALRGATLYVGLEPCAHHGKQPPCIDALMPLGLARCVVAAGDPHPLVDGAGLKVLAAAGTRVDVGVLGPEMRAWHLPFLAGVARRRPLFAGKWAQTLNGLFADDAGASQWLSGAASRAYTHHLRHRYDAIMVGGRTVLRDVPRLSARDLPYPATRHPLKVIFDPRANVLDAAAAERGRIHEALLADGGRVLHVVAASRLADARAFAHGDWLAVGIDTARAVPSLAETLAGEEVTAYHGKPLQSVLVEGGPRLLNVLWQEGHLDVAHVFVVPALLAGATHRLQGFAAAAPAAGGLPLARMATVATHQLGDDVLMELVSPDLLPLLNP